MTATIIDCYQDVKRVSTSMTKSVYKKNTLPLTKLLPQLT